MNLHLIKPNFYLSGVHYSPLDIIQVHWGDHAGRSARVDRVEREDGKPQSERPHGILVDDIQAKWKLHVSFFEPSTMSNCVGIVYPPEIKLVELDVICLTIDPFVFDDSDPTDKSDNDSATSYNIQVS